MNRSRADVALVVVAAVWGSSYLAAKTLLTPETAIPLLALRFAVAATVLAVAVAPRLRSTTRAELICGIALGGVLTGILTLETLGVLRTSASNAGLIIATTIVVTPLLDRRLPGSFYCATLIAIAGVAVLTRTGFAAPNLGDLLILLAAFARAVHVTMMSRMNARRQLDPVRVTLIQLAVATGIFTAASGGGRIVAVAADMTADAWALTLYLAVGCTVFAFLVQMWAVRETSPSRVALLLGTEPIWAAATGIVLAGDVVTGATVAGALLILAGTNWARRIETRVLLESPVRASGIRCESETVAQRYGPSARVRPPTPSTNIGWPRERA